MPKILQISVDGNTGSTGRIAESIGRLAIARGWESYIAHGRLSGPSESITIKIGSAIDVYMHGFQTRLFDRHGLGSKHATIKLVNQIKEIKPDVIHLHNLHGYYINIEVLFNFLSETSIAVVWTFHDCWAFTGHCAHFDFVGCEKWKTACHHCPQKKEYPASLIIDRSRLNYHLKKSLFNSVKNMTIVSVSKWLDTKVKESFLGSVNRTVIYNGIDIELFKPDENIKQIKRELNIENKFILLGVAKPWSKNKGLEDFIEISKKITDDMIIILVGLNQKQIKTLPKNIIGLQKTKSQKELKEIYNSADIFLNLSLEETFGLTTAEALACGVPVIVYNSTACPEIIDENTGIMVKRKNIEDILLAITTIKNNGKAFYSRLCRKRAVDLYNKNDRYKEYIDLYESIIN